jgi:hypothetical protein
MDFPVILFVRRLFAPALLVGVKSLEIAFVVIVLGRHTEKDLAEVLFVGGCPEQTVKQVK